MEPYIIPAMYCITACAVGGMIVRGTDTVCETVKYAVDRWLVK